MYRIIHLRKMIFVVLALSLLLSACGINDTKNTVSSDSLTELVEAESTEAEIFVQAESEKLRDTITMNYDLEEVIVNGNKADMLYDVDYSLDELICISSYAETGTKLYAYTYDYKTEEGQTYTDLKLLLEHDRKREVYGRNEYISFSCMFGYDIEDGDGLETRTFEEGYECDFDNDGSIELVKIITVDYASGISNMGIIIFDYNESIGEYEAYYIDKSYFSDLINEAMMTFFDKYYCPYTVENKRRYYFQNGFEVCAGMQVDCFVDDNGEIIMMLEVRGDPRNDGSMHYYIGSLNFKVNYIGEGRFSVKALSYAEEKNIMDPNADLW